MFSKSHHDLGDINGERNAHLMGDKGGHGSIELQPWVRHRVTNVASAASRDPAKQSGHLLLAFPSNK